MKNITKIIVLTLLVAFAMSFGVNTTAEAAGKSSVKSVSITAPTKKSTYTVNRKATNVKKQLKVSVKTTGKASKAVTYKSSNKAVVSVSSKGLLTFKKAGKATITVTSKANKKKKDTVKITVKQLSTSVKASVKKSIASYNGVYTLQVKKNYSISKSVAPSKVSNKAVSYKSSNAKVAKVDKNGKIQAKKAGTATITVTAKDKGKAKTSFKVIVTKKISKKVSKVESVAKNSTLLVGTTTALATTVTPSNATLKTVVYGTSNAKVATVDAKGTVKAVAPGTAKITVKAMDGSKKSATVTITVKAAATSVTFASTTAKAYVGKTATVKATTNADAFDTTVTYSIDAASQKVATVDSKTGVVKGIARGTVNVTAKSVNGKTATCKVEVVDQVVTKVTLKNAAEGQSATATMKFDGNKEDVEKDIIALLKKAGVKENQAYTVNVNGKDYKAVYTGTKLTFDGKELKEVTQTEAIVSVTATKKAADFIKALQLATFANVSYTSYEVTVGDFTFTSASSDGSYVTAVANGKTYKAYAEGEAIYFVGNVKAEVEANDNAGRFVVEVKNN